MDADQTPKWLALLPVVGGISVIATIKRGPTWST